MAAQQPSMAALAKQMAILPAIFLMNKISLDEPEDADRRVMLAVAFGVWQLIMLALNGFLWKKVTEKNEAGTVNIPAVTSALQPPQEAKTMSIHDYDKSKIKEGVQQVVMSSCILAFIVYQFGSVKPLFIQLFLGPVQLTDAPLFKSMFLDTQLKEPLLDPGLRRTLCALTMRCYHIHPAFQCMLLTLPPCSGGLAGPAAAPETPATETPATETPKPVEDGDDADQDSKEDKVESKKDN
eukprot:CAMPEP_0175916618 /NCGR_PEP_ID=MMETSP0108-20121206/10941_1 /TAXON_ID=195067 ORGANISM="Goniomonas pacifica, Strain CCMP1869" /NCGR_SAMPLE_ID=MMETSP0108 /ASSEMBLY_ACC=CAM_ASM_000204 /LENGTH=238 /DNA_ID=CAMNT_0017239179 /DNA_START=10 /DNA_END=727 /DNA_ORIENTATION=+